MSRTPTTHPLRCRCGSVQGELLHPRRTLHAVCYCLDCQAYAHALGVSEQVLDADGGTEVVATQAKHLRITAGRDRLACLMLTERGILRWYAGCCRTPIANTPRDMRLPYAGVLHACLAPAGGDLSTAFGPVRLRVNTPSARRPVPPPRPTQALALLRIGPGLLWSRLTGGWRRTPFLDAATGRPAVRPHVLTAEERRDAIARSRSS